MAKFLYFRDTASSQYIVPVERLLGADDTGSNTVILKFEDMGGAVAASVVTLNVDAGKEKDVMVALLNRVENEKSDVLVVADDVTASYLLTDISSIASIAHNQATAATGLTLGGDITATSAAIDFDLKTATANALTFDDGGTTVLGISTDTNGVAVTGVFSASAGVSVGGNLTVTGDIILAQGTEATSADSTAAVTAANILTGVVKCTPTAARAKDTDTAANLVSGLGLSADGNSFDFSFINLTASTHAVTLAGGTGVTLVGSGVIAAASSARFRAARTGATAVTLYRLA